MYICMCVCVCVCVCAHTRSEFAATHLHYHRDANEASYCCGFLQIRVPPDAGQAPCCHTACIVRRFHRTTFEGSVFDVVWDECLKAAQLLHKVQCME
mmetsp:Transcript_86971/g.145122  ORF Transcript_86971/g.145122 Transcript_86971/m.145122 type:complete len:97 (+) Transcript_86971:1773-2063(+)